MSISRLTAGAGVTPSRLGDVDRRDSPTRSSGVIFTADTMVRKSCCHRLVQGQQHETRLSIFQLERIEGPVAAEHVDR